MSREQKERERRTDFLRERFPKPEILRRPPKKQSRQEQRTHRPSLLRIERFDRLTNRRRAEELGQKLMQLAPERLCMGEESVQASDGGRTPKICGGPSIGSELWWCLDRQRGWA